MLEYALNIAVVGIFALVIVWLGKRIQLVERGADLSVTKRRFGLILLAAVILLVKFLSIGDAVLITGQALLVFMWLVFGWWSYLPAVPRKTGSSAKKTPAKKMAPAKAAEVSAGSRSGGPSKLLFVGVLILAVIVGVILGLMHSFNGLSQGTVAGSEQAAPSSPAPKELTLAGVHFSLVYPNNFNQVTIDAPHAPIIENYSFTKPDIRSWRLAIQVESLPSGNLNDDGSYHSRAVNPGRFTITPTSVNGYTMYIVTDNASDGAFAKAAYFVHDGLLGSVALTGGSSDTLDQMQSLYMAMLQSWQWR